jgi:hypothetical protein
MAPSWAAQVGSMPSLIRTVPASARERGVPEAAELTEAYQDACGDGGGRPALP